MQPMSRQSNKISSEQVHLQLTSLQENICELQSCALNRVSWQEMKFSTISLFSLRPKLILQLEKK